MPNPLAEYRLFCFPYAGGSAGVFRAWQRYLPQNIELCPIELPGRGTRFSEAPLTSIEELVKAIAYGILPLLDRPFAFFGHSMGAWVSFELTRWLRQEYNLQPIHLFLSARRAPQIPALVPPIHVLPDAEFIEQIRLYNGMNPALLEDAEFMELILPVLRADFTVLETYTYRQQKPLECPITAFGGWQDGDTSGESLQAWQIHSNRSFLLQMFPGDHFFLDSARPSLISAITEQINRQ
ncbi:thioesterase II family protein [Merismopedia glauca]|uniref:Putative thioesterase n=1 Tax=Merismopedia glauca CCAP 1448/3 TaxID=1296344 RepID=A0A2T1C0E9_9CYAN|nr:alpha/beta fold hydrolase [Merismopedia glauca]PSB01755.1 putative thioesterase [Merismopedia glauca CCAP 1448/3]